MKYTPEMRSFIEKNAKGISTKELTQMLSEQFPGVGFSCSSVRYFKKNHKIRSGFSCRFEKGHVSPFKGKSFEELGFFSEDAIQRMKAGQFKKGNKPHTYLPVGSEVIRGDGYLYRKIADPNKWKQVHIILWESVHGTIPMGNKLTFLNGNRLDLRIENLSLISNSENLALTRNNLRFNDPELTKNGIGIAKLLVKTSEMERRYLDEK